MESLMPPLQPLSGQEVLDDLQVAIRWETVGSDHAAVRFCLSHPEDRDMQVVVLRDGTMDFPEDNLIGFSSMKDLRRVTTILTWCYRMAYAKVFHIQNVDQLLFQ